MAQVKIRGKEADRSGRETGPPVAGVQLIGPLPGELGSISLFTGGIGAETASPDAAKALIEFLSGKDAAPHFKSKGFEPGG